MAEIRATTEGMIAWKFKCSECGYRFKAITPKIFYDDCTECAMCNSKEFEKKMAKGDYGNGKKGNKD